ncbi:MAG TPA: GatB/YqeY domain-containing protein [Candidatus Pacearchaeota archaeon]|nr:GatB/YqeY domain-containing protein [Candidatus Pacearchaeota archaeon]
MNSLKQKIQDDLNINVKEEKENVCSVLRLLLSSILNKEKEKRFKISKEKNNISEENLKKESQITDEEIVDVISSEIKKRKDAIELYEKGNRLDLSEKEKKEIEILKKYLPEQLPLEEIKNLVENSIKKVEANSIKDMGKVMSDLMPKIKGRADNSEVSKIVKELLSYQK